MNPFWQFKNNSVAVVTLCWIVTVGGVSPAGLLGEVVLEELVD